MKRRIILLSVAAMTSLTGFFWGKHFDLAWDEEVLLPDGEVIVVHRKTTYERHSQGLTKYSGESGGRDTALTFDAGGTTGQITQLFKGFRPLFLGRDGDTWYAVLIGAHYYKSQEIPGQNWGEPEGPNGNRAAKLVGDKFVSISLLELPAKFTQPNMFLLYADAKEVSQFDGKRMTLEDKAQWLKLHPPGPAHLKIERPKTSK